MTDLPWPISGDIEHERTCERCAGTIPPHWRHYWKPCACTWAPVPGEDFYHAPDPACPTCDGSGYEPCEPQNLSILRRWGYCQACGALSLCYVRAVEPVGDIAGSGQHAEGFADHEVTVVAGPLVKVLGDYLDEAAAAATMYYRCPDCGILTEVDLDIQGEPFPGAMQEFAVTCDCGKTAWFELWAKP